MEVVRSINGVPIRLPEERWVHNTEEHCELAGYFYEVLETVVEPVAVFEGSAGEFLAVRPVDEGMSLVVVYREVGTDDGFIITAFLTKRLRRLERRAKVWPR